MDNYITIHLLYSLYGKKLFSCVHNIFIAIIERGFSSLRDVPPVQGNESSDEEDSESGSSPKKQKADHDLEKRK